MRNTTKYIALFFAIATFNFAHAQVSDTERKWTISECLQYATEHNIQISTLRLNEQSVQQELSAARAVKIPDLSASASNTFNNAKNTSGTDNRFVNQLISSGNYTLNSAIILWNDNFINNNIRQKSLLTQSASLSVQQ